MSVSPVRASLFPSTLLMVLFFNGEFDPGSGRTLAACLTHASRAERPFGVLERRTGELHVSILPLALGQLRETGINTGYDYRGHPLWWKGFPARDGLAAYQLVGGVIAYQGDDG